MTLDRLFALSATAQKPNSASHLYGASLYT